MIENQKVGPRLSRPGSRRLPMSTVVGAAASLLAIAAWAGPAMAQKAGSSSERRPSERRSSEQPTNMLGSETPNAAGSSRILVSSDEDYHIGIGDVIEIQVEDMPEVSRKIRVTAHGTFLMPILGRMTAQGKTPEAIAQEIADRLRGDYLKDPQVSVMVREYNSCSFFIQGAVRSPGVFQIEGNPSLLTLITLAGGLAENHGAVSFVIRREKRQAGPEQMAGTAGQSNDRLLLPVGQAAPSGNERAAGPDAQDEEPKYELLRVNINTLLRGDFSNNALLQPGDIVNIPPSGVFYVAGEVNRPGSFSLKEGTTLRQAISLAQGTNYNAATDRAIIFRDAQDKNGTRQELHIDIAAIMKGKKDDIPILADDIVMIPNSRMKTFGGALIKAFGLSTATRVPIPVY